MGKIKLAVIGETRYADRLGECMKRNAPDYLEVLSCMEQEELQDFIRQMQPDILLCEKGTTEGQKFSGDIIQIELVDEMNVKETERTNVAVSAGSIFRYQQGSEILRQIFQIYAKHSDKNLVSRCNTAQIEMTACYAPGGHELLLPFSVSYAAVSGKEAKVLFLNLSEFSGMRTLFMKKDRENLSDLIFGIRQRKEHFLLCLQSVLHHTDQFDYVLPPENPEDLYEIQEEDLACLLTLLQEQTEYTKIIWSCGTLNQASMQIMECCSSVFCLVRENVAGRNRKTEFEQFLNKKSRQRLREKVKYVSPQMGSGKFVQGTDLWAQLRSGEFAKQVRVMTQETVNKKDT